MTKEEFQQKIAARRAAIKTESLNTARMPVQKTEAIKGINGAVSSDVLMENWGRQIKKFEAAAPQNIGYARRECLAKSLNNTQLRLEALSTQTSDMGKYKIFALDMVGAVVQNLIAPDIVSVQTMDSPVGMVRYIEYDYGTTKGEVDEGTAFADSRNFYQSSSTYSTSDVVNEALTLVAGTSQSFTLDFAPINPSTVQLNLKIGSTAVTLVDNGSGALTSATSGYSGTINYSTGAVTLTLGAAAVVATDSAASNYSYAITYVDNTASSSRIPAVTMNIKTIPMIAKPRRMKAIWSFDSMFIMDNEYNKNLEEIMNATVAGEIMHEIDDEVMTDLYKGAAAGVEQTWSATVPVGISRADHYNSFRITLDECSAAIFQATRKWGANFVVGGVGLKTVCPSIIGFKAADKAGLAGPHLLGTLPDGMKVYINPTFAKDTFVAGFAGGDDIYQTGYILGMYMPVCSTEMVQLEDMAGRKGWAAAYGKAMVNNKMYIRGKILNLTI